MTKASTGFLATIGLVAGLFFGSASCDEADAAFDCQSVCSRYKDCFDKDYNVGDCRARCRDKADADSDFRRKADVCEACIDDRSCTASAFACTAQCAGIVP
ncbi:MAG TPA: hypothetical protein VGF45_10940 [Polyangia bacterium]